MKKLAFVILFTCVFVLYLGAQMKTVAVVPFSIQGDAVSKDERNSITELYSSELIDTGRVRVVDKSKVKEMLDKMSLKDGDYSNAKKTSILGDATDAQALSYGSIMKLGSYFYISATLIDVKTAKAISSAKVKFISLNQIQPLMQELAGEIVGGITIKVGDIGPGGGIIFYIEGDKCLECSELLGMASWKKAKTMCEDYKGGSYLDWYLPTKEELGYMYENLRKKNKIRGSEHYWSSTSKDIYDAWAQDFSSGEQMGMDLIEKGAVRAIRAFNMVVF